MLLVEAIKSNEIALAAAELGDWEACRVAMAAVPVTRHPVPLDRMLWDMNMRGMLTRLPRPAGGGEEWSGTVLNMVLATGIPAALTTALNQFFSHITNDRNITFDTTNPAFGQLFATIMTTFAGLPGMPTQADFDAIVSLGGGWRFASVTAAECQQAWKAENDRLRLETDRVRNDNWQQRFNDAMNQIGTSEQADGVAAVRRIASEMEAI